MQICEQKVIKLALHYILPSLANMFQKKNSPVKVLLISHLFVRKNEKEKCHDRFPNVMFTTLIGKYKSDSNLATVTDDSSSFPPSVSPQRVAAIGNARQRLSLSTLHGFVTQATADRESLLESR